MPAYASKGTGPAVTVIPPACSVILGVDPNVNVQLSVVVTVIEKPASALYAESVTPPGDPSTFLNLTVSLVDLP